MALHPPSHYRAIVQQAKQGRPMADLVEEARAVGDPSFAAEALFFLSGDPRLPAANAAALADEAFRRLDKAEREWRRAEVLVDWAHRGPKWREGDAAAAAPRERIQQAIAERALRLGRGPPRSQVLQALGKWRPESFAARLLAAALGNGESAAQDAKALLRAGPATGVREALEACPDAALRARLLAFLHAHGGGPLLEAAVRTAEALPAKESVEALRAIVASLESLEDLRAMHRLLPADAEARARLLSALAARVDKAGDSAQAKAWFEEGLQAAAKIPDGETRQAVLANLEQGLERLGGKPGRKPGPVGPMGPGKAVQAPAAPSPGTRHWLALCDTYEGGLGETHLRAVARAAPLCWAFDLDLALLGFPTKDLDRLVRQASKETSIGDSGRHVSDLAREGRIHLVECGAKDLPDWDAIGLPVATTPEPDPAKRIGFDGLPEAASSAGARRVCLVMGLGKHGLPPAWLKAIPHHLEVTGRNVSLETATAMGILAERLRQVPPL